MVSRKAFGLSLVLMLVLSTVLVSAQAAPAPKGSQQTPRNETLYMNGLQWGAPSSFNMLSSNPAWPCNQNRFLVYEALFMFDQIKGTMDPLLAKSLAWADDYTLDVTLNSAAHFNDGQALTADDVAYSFELGKKYAVSWSPVWLSLESVTAKSSGVVEFKLTKENYNRLNVLDALTNVPIHPMHVWTKIEADNNNDIAKIATVFNEDPVASGPYKVYYWDDTKITIVRDDNYWGKALFGKLPAPKYITHIIFKSNDAGNLALKNGEVDMSQQFTPKVWLMWKDGSPIKTYLPKLPYYIPAAMPQIFFNMTKKGLNVPEVRRAIAMSIDYKKIGDVAMSGYTDPIVPGIVLSTPAEAKMVDQTTVKPYLWTTDVNGANKLLDSIGAKKGKDGIRSLKDGTRLGPWDIECPYGWSDWNASLEIVMQSAKKVGIELRTKFPEQPVWNNDMQTGGFDIIMNTPQGNASPSQPWIRARTIMLSEGVAPIGEIAYWNWGRFKDARADELLNIIPTKSDPAELKKLYTELDVIYLKNIPTIPLMYRPSLFYTVNEKVWKGMPVQGDGNNIPPQILSDGAGIKGLYVIHN
jgi:peptide/nickel transport system substrate-binding protein